MRTRTGGKRPLRAFARVLALLSMGLSGLYHLCVASPAVTVLALPKALAAAAAPLVGLAGMIGAALGLVIHEPLAIFAGVLGAWASVRHIRQVTAPHDGFERAFGPDWRHRMSPEQQVGMLKRRWRWWMPPSPEPRWERDVAYHTVPATEEREARPLLCDVWRPPEGVTSSGIGVVYLHGSAWCAGDKDLCTRPFFRHLAGQGHVVMDIAYRLYPETDILGMTHDVRQAVAWIKRQAGRYGTDPGRIVLGGGSAGGHLALLAAYTPGHPDLTPDSLIESDLSVCGAFAHYGAADMRAVLKHAGRVLPDQPGPSLRAVVSMAESVMGDAVKGVNWREFSAVTMVGNPLGGSPEEVPEMYDLASPITHVSGDCPPTLLLHGEHDFVMPPDASRQLHQKLVEAGVASVLVTSPQTTHGFELFLPQISPAAQAATYEVDRFLSLLAQSPTA